MTFADTQTDRQLLLYINHDRNDNVGDYDGHHYHGDDDDDIYIMVKCLSVSKSHYFCIQRIWVFLMFIDTFPFSKVSGNRRNDQIP